MTITVVVVFLAVVLLLMKFDFIVFNRYVFDFQISHILKRGRIKNLREYNAVLNAVEQRFDRDNERFASDVMVKTMNGLLTEFHRDRDTDLPTPDGN